MKKRTILTALILIGGGLAVYQNWDAISRKVDWTDYSPQHHRAIDLAKDAFNFDQYQNNFQFINNQINQSNDEIEPGTWIAESQGDDVYLVSYEFKVNGEPDGYYFMVHVDTWKVDQVNHVDVEHPILTRTGEVTRPE